MCKKGVIIPNRYIHIFVGRGVKIFNTKKIEPFLPSKLGIG